MDKLTAMRVFSEVAERGSLTQAADQLAMSTAMVSRYLAALEKWLGARLLHRTTRRISLTEAGQMALLSCHQMLALSTAMQTVVGERSQEPTGTLRIVSSASFAEEQLTTALLDFQRQHSQVDIVLSVTDRLVDLVEDRVDVAIRITNTLDPNAIARPLAQCHSVLCASPAYLAQHGQPDTLEDLAQHIVIGRSDAGGLSRYRFYKEGKWLEVPVKSHFSTNETAILRRAVLAGAGIGLLPTYYVGAALQQGQLLRLLPAYEPESLGLYAIYLSRQYQPLALRLLLAFLAERFSGELAPWD